MSITAISRDWGSQPSIVRITTTDNLTAITTAGYIDTQADEIEALNNGAFEWVDGDLVAIDYSNGEGFFTLNSANGAFVAVPAGAGLSATLSSGNIFVGNASNVATGVPMSGDATMANTGAMTIANNAITTAKINAGAVTLAKLATGIAPSHVIKFAARVTTVGGSASEVIAIPGALATDLQQVTIVDNGTNNVNIVGTTLANNQLTVVFNADPGADAVVSYQLSRVAA